MYLYSVLIPFAHGDKVSEVILLGRGYLLDMLGQRGDLLLGFSVLSCLALPRLGYQVPYHVDLAIEPIIDVVKVLLHGLSHRIDRAFPLACRAIAFNWLDHHDERVITLFVLLANMVDIVG